MANFFGVGQSPLGNPFPRSLPGFAPRQWAPFQIGNAPAAGAVGPAVGPVAGVGAPGGGALPGSWNPASGGIPQTPNPATSLENLLAGIGGNLGGLGDIVRGITGTANQALRDQYPAEYFDTLATQLGNVGRRARGDIEDLFPLRSMQSAEWAQGQGVGGAGSPISNLHLQGLLGRTRYDVMRDALQDQGAIQNLIPRVAPYDPSRLLPTFTDQYGSELQRNIFGSAPIPEAAFNRNLALANQGLNRGINAGFSPVQRFSPGGPLFQPNLAGMLPQGVATAPTVPTGPGWGFGIGEGGFAGGGNIPPEEINQFIDRMGPLSPPQFDQGPGFFENAGNIWDTPFDMPIDFGGDQFFEEFDEFFD